MDALMSIWTGKSEKPRHAGPWTDGKVRPQWLRRDGGKAPAIGPTGRSSFMRAFGDRREQAYRAYVERISNAWRDHER
jgi:hypothetical protein